MESLTDTVESQLQALKTRALEFSSVFDQFQRIRGYTVNNPALKADWERANTYASAIKNTVMWINGQVDGAVNWLSRTIGLSGVGEVGRMGAVPLISAAYLVSATAALVFATDWMIKIIREAENEARKIELVDSGKADQSILYPDKGTIGGALSGAGDLLKWAIIAGAVWYFAPKLLEKLK